MSTMRTRFGILICLGLALLAAGFGLMGRDLYMRAKAQLADVLIARAFAAHLENGRPHPPWKWADMHPIARLEVPRLGVSRHVLTGASGTTMAFGIGHLDGTAPPNSSGHTVLVGHRDSWCAFLKEVQCGDRVALRTASGAGRYRVVALRVIAETDLEILDKMFSDRLTLLTCYPFAGVLNSPLRYAVICTRDSL